MRGLGTPEPMPLIGNVASAQHHRTRIDQPHVRRGWLDRGPGGVGRGDEAFVPVSKAPKKFCVRSRPVIAMMRYEISRVLAIGALDAHGTS
ncbi:hypothetical protein [Nocardia sp. NPDC050710]|uniref:hypothetical protein n=1 Tax=Nocardia sp. NPDC050710 TaxID=3157220 RepID=UPI0033F0666A